MQIAIVRLELANHRKLLREGREGEMWMERALSRARHRFFSSSAHITNEAIDGVD